MAYRGSQARGQIRAAASGLHHSHSDSKSEPHQAPNTSLWASISSFYFFLKFIYFCLFRATPMTYGDSQAGGRIGAGAPSLHQSHSDAGSEPHL